MKSSFAPTEEELEFARASMPMTTSSRSKKTSKFEPTEEEMQFAQNSMAEPELNEIPWYKSYPAAIGKGLARGIVSFGESFGGLKEPPEIKQEQAEQRETVLQEYLPSEEGFTEGVLEKGAEILPYALAGPGKIGESLLRTGAAALGSQTVKEAGFGEGVQTATELAAFLSPKFGKKIIPTKGQKEILSEGRRLGLSDKELTPLIQSEKKQKFLSKFASRGEDMQDILKGSKKAVDNLYNVLEESKFGKNIISDKNKNILINGFKKKFERLPEDLRRKIAPDFHDLITGDITGNKLINFWQDINHYIKKGNSGLGILKDPVLKAINGVSPEFSKDFQSINKLYQNSARIRQRLNPKEESVLSKFMDKTSAYRALAGFISGYSTIMYEALGEIAGREITKRALTNPRFQNIGKQMIHAISENKLPLANNLKNVLKEEVDYPEFSEMLDEIDLSVSEPKKKR